LQWTSDNTIDNTEAHAIVSASAHRR